MILSKDDILEALRHEVHIIIHLASKVGEEQLTYQPSPKQKSTLDLLRYLTMVGPIHMGGALSTKPFDMADWGRQWKAQEAEADLLDAGQTVLKIAALPALFKELLDPCTDEFLREEVQLFGTSYPRAVWILNLVLSHYTAYRMQLFLYLKASGLDHLNTMNLWLGIDAPM